MGVLHMPARATAAGHHPLKRLARGMSRVRGKVLHLQICSVKCKFCCKTNWFTLSLLHLARTFAFDTVTQPR